MRRSPRAAGGVDPDTLGSGDVCIASRFELTLSTGAESSRQVWGVHLMTNRLASRL